MADSAILNRVAETFPHLKDRVESIKNNYTLKLWHQVSDTLIEIFHDHQARSSPILMDLYRDFIAEFETKIDQIKLAQIISRASKFSPGNYLARNTFIAKIQDRLIKDDQATLLCDLQKVQNMMDDGVYDEAITLLNEIQKKLDKIPSKEPVLYSWFYYTRATYHHKRGQYDEYYKDTLKFLAYTPEGYMSEKEKLDLCISMAVAVLVSENIYNFSELIEQPILSTLEKSLANNWIWELIKTFNEGSVKGFHDKSAKFQSQIAGHAELKDKVKFLDQKIRILAFLELIFRLPKNERVLTFETVAKASEIPLEEVEHLVMKAMALDIVRGSIDEIERVVRVTWIQPRVIDKARIEIMRNKVDEWGKSLGGLLKSIEGQLAQVPAIAE